MNPTHQLNPIAHTPQSAPSTSLVNGIFYYDISINRFGSYDGSAWQYYVSQIDLSSCTLNGGFVSLYTGTGNANGDNTQSVQVGTAVSLGSLFNPSNSSVGNASVSQGSYLLGVAAGAVGNAYYSHSNLTGRYPALITARTNSADFTSFTALSDQDILGMWSAQGDPGAYGQLLEGGCAFWQAQGAWDGSTNTGCWFQIYVTQSGTTSPYQCATFGDTVTVYTTFSAKGISIPINAISGALGSASTFNFSVYGKNKGTLTSATVCTLSFTAPATGAQILFGLQQPATGTVTTVVFPSTVVFPGGFAVQPVPILGATTWYLAEFDGSKYNILAVTSSAGIPTVSYPVNTATALTTSFVYLSNKLTIPANTLQVGTSGRFTMWLTNTGTANNTTIALNFGTAGTTADTAINGTVATTGTAAAGVAVVEIIWTVRSIGSSGVIEGLTKLVNNGTTGFHNAATLVAFNAATVNTTVANYMGVSMKGSVGSVATVQSIIPEITR